MTASIRLAAVLLACSLPLSACKKEKAPAATSSPAPATEVPAANPEGVSPATARRVGVDACTLLMADEVIAAIGNQVQVEPSWIEGAQLCAWRAPSGAKVVVQLHDSASDFDASRLRLERSHRGKAENVPEFGEQAFFLGDRTEGFSTATVSAVQKDRFVTVRLIGTDVEPDSLKPRALELTRAVLGRI